jgi:hypothetical protein
VAGKRKGRDTHLENEGRESKKGVSKTEMQALMKKMMGNAEGEAMPTSPLMPNMPTKGGKRGPV